MFKILDGREAFYQWDVDRKIVVEDRGITQVHFCNRTDDCALICECYEHEGNWVADVPNILLQDNWRIRVYAYDGCATMHDKKYDVIARSKPDTYVYTETEVLNYETIKKQMDAINNDIEGVVRDYLEENPLDVDLTGYATEKYVDDAISTIELTPGKDGKDGVDGKDGYTPIKGVDYFDGKDGQPGKDGAPGADGKDYILTEADKQEIASMVDVPGGGGTIIESVEEVYVGSTTPTDENIKLWINPDEQVTFATIKYVDDAIAAIEIPESGGGGGSVAVDGKTIIQNADGTISTALGGSKILTAPGTDITEAYEDPDGFTTYNANAGRYCLPGSRGYYYLNYSFDQSKKYIIDLEFRNANTGATGSCVGYTVYEGSVWKCYNVAIFDDQIVAIGENPTNNMGLYLTSVNEYSGTYHGIYYVTKMKITSEPTYSYETIDSNYLAVGDGLSINGNGVLISNNPAITSTGYNTVLMNKNSIRSGKTPEDSVVLGSGNSVGSNKAILLGSDNSTYASSACQTLIGNGNYSDTYAGYGTAVGYTNMINANYTFAAGTGLSASSAYQTAYGRYNMTDASSAYNVIIGNGADASNLANGLTIAPNGNVTIQGTVSSAGADYAEYFEWLDGNPNGEDRVGLLVCLDGDKIRLAQFDDDDILGIVSGTATVLGDDAEWAWQGKYMRDSFGRLIMEEVIHYDEEGKVIDTVMAPKINPEYDATKPYTSRAKRVEWDAVGMMGKLYLRHDGTACVGDYVDTGADGVATLATGKTNMRVMERISDSIVRVLLK